MGLGFRVTALAAAVAAASTATAQELEEVVITGSRIPVNVNATSSVPVQSLSEEDIRRSGEINIADIVADIPALVSSQTAENSLTGSNALNLRGLGSARTTDPSKRAAACRRFPRQPGGRRGHYT